MNHKNVIEINGKKYDPKSGALLSMSAPQTSKQIDGIIRPAHKPRVEDPAIHKGQPQSTNKHHIATSKSSHNPRRRRNIQKSHTLMRSGVTKPAQQAKSPHTIHRFARSHNTADVKKSDYIHKYTHHLHPPKVDRKEAQLDVAQHPAQTEAKTQTQHHVKQTPPPASLEKQHSAEQLIRQALADAPTTRTKHLKRKRTHRLGKLATIGTSAVLLVGFILYMNYGQIQMQLASSKAGFAVSSPNYIASGYSLNQPVKSEPGSVTLSFTSNTDNRRYELIQEASGWNSASLQENYLKARNVDYRSSSDAGRTIFIYDETNATWVSGGIWYTITSDSLSSDQLVKIATSI